MMAKKHLGFAFLLALPLSVSSACALQGGSRDQSGLAGDRQGQGTTNGFVPGGSVEAGVFKLYDKPFFQPDLTCDGFTALQLVNGETTPVAVMENKLEGTCELPVPPADRRTYDLKEGEKECGSRTYAGQRVVTGIAGEPDKTYKLSIVDHRSRTCRDLVEAKVIVVETYPEGASRTYYSASVTPPPAVVTHTGVLTRIQGIGGESTGFGLQLDDGSLVELDLRSAGLHTEFKEDRRVSVTGSMKEVAGVETTRQVLFVAKLSAAP